MEWFGESIIPPHPSTTKADSNENLYLLGKTWGETNGQLPSLTLASLNMTMPFSKTKFFRIREWGTYYEKFPR
jgi:hypothetical protein